MGLKISGFTTPLRVPMKRTSCSRIPEEPEFRVSGTPYVRGPFRGILLESPCRTRERRGDSGNAPCLLSTHAIRRYRSNKLIVRRGYYRAQ